jgi:hypothetical protein
MYRIWPEVRMPAFLCASYCMVSNYDSTAELTFTTLYQL